MASLSTFDCTGCGSEFIMGGEDIADKAEIHCPACGDHIDIEDADKDN